LQWLDYFLLTQRTALKYSNQEGSRPEDTPKEILDMDSASYPGARQSLVQLLMNEHLKHFIRKKWATSKERSGYTFLI